jgi:drug/metabolite transporter (DMT)-like permease
MKHFFFSLPLGLRYMLLSGLGFALMAVFVKLASAEGLPLLEIVAARALVSLILSYADIRRKRIPAFGTRKGLLFLRGLVGSLTLVCVYFAITRLPLAEATVLQYLYPVITAALAVYFLKESLHWTLLLSIVLSFSGVLLIARPGLLFGELATDLSYVAVLAALLGAFGSAVAYVLVRKLSQTEDPSVIVFYFPLIALPFSLILLGDDAVLPDWKACSILLLVGIFTQIGQICLTRAMQTETASRATAFSYAQVVFAALLGWLVFDEVPDLWFAAGALLILIGILVNIVRSRLTKA